MTGDDWKLRAATVGDHKKARAPKADWVQQHNKMVTRAVSMPAPRALHETRPDGAALPNGQTVAPVQSRNKKRLEDVTGLKG